MRARPKKLLQLLGLTLQLACQSTSEPQAVRAASAMKKLVVVKHDWHSSLILSQSDFVAHSGWPLSQLDSRDALIEFAWGDERYYQAEEPSVTDGIAALFWPTPSVMHVRTWNKKEFERAKLETVTVNLSDTGYQKTLRYIQESFFAPDQRPVPIGIGLSPKAYFFHANGYFFAFSTCNSWVAKALAYGGIPVFPSLAFTAWGLMSQVRSYQSTLEH